ncbi:hypothetical protein lerEdw1_004207 [Lerista edwardsae]|nr:hypothetical protein lerEdw1_004211 [Lerista edwardsae]KAJ6650732.1 hypothetical protein lerEdw1_004207 [Lerista edwardsae]
MFCLHHRDVFLISGKETFELSTSPFVIGNVGQDAVLPCQISLGTQPQNMEVQWKKMGEDHVDNIYQFRAVTGQETFGPGYQGRIGLMKEGMATGNVSLKLKKVQVTDEGTYSCIVKSNRWSADTRTVLQVAGQKMASQTIQNPQFESKQDHEQLFSSYSTITVTRDSGEITCSVHEKRLQKKQEVTILLSQNIFPYASPWLLAFWILFGLTLLFVAVVVYYKYKGIQKRKLEEQTKEHIKLLQQTNFKTKESERAQRELEFRRARSYLVNILLDTNYKHQGLALSWDFRNILHKFASSEATVPSGALIVIGTEGFEDGRQYWEVRVDEKPNWEVGVLTEDTRNKLKTGGFDASQEEQRWSLRRSNGKYYPEEADYELQKYTVPPRVVGIFLDRKEHSISFYDVKGMKVIVKIPVEVSEKLYPFLSPGIPEEEENVKPLAICQERDWDFPLQL